MASGMALGDVGKEQGQLSELSSDSPQIDAFDLPRATTSWNRSNVEKLKISIDEAKFQSPESEPLDLIQLLIGCRNWSRIEKPMNVISAAIDASLAYQWLDYPLDHLTLGRSVIERLATRSDMWDINDSEDRINGPLISEFEISFRIAGRDFTDRLIDFVDRKDKKETITEYMYQHLFISFLQLFSIRCQFAPCTPLKSMNINGRTVSGKPDISVRSLKFTSVKRKPIVDWQTLVICEVKKDLIRYEASAPKRLCTRSPAISRTSEDTDAQHSKLPHCVLGQHAAELLLFYPSSVSSKHVLGIIVEQTTITFVLLAITQKQYKDLMNGTLKDDIMNGPKLYVSKCYDYLVWKDRQYLTKALLTLGLMQNHIKYMLDES